MGKSYKVEGTSKVKPTNLPEGLTVKEETVPGATSLFGTEFTSVPYRSAGEDFVSMTITSKPDYYGKQDINTTKLFTPKQARALIADVTQALEGLPNQRRVILDASDYRANNHTSWRWYETDNGKFTYEISEPSSSVKGDTTYEKIESSYGIQEISFY